MTLWINDSNASTVEIERGVDAAIKRMRRFKHDPLMVWQRLNDESDPLQQKWAQEIWADAEYEAFKAAFDGWARWPEAAILVWEGEA
jgi:hypothetical protein